MTATKPSAARIAEEAARLKLPARVVAHALLRGLGARRPWTAAEDDLIRREYAALGRATLAARLDRTEGAVCRRAGVLGVRPSRAAVVWSPAELARLTAEYEATEDVDALAARLNRSKDAIVQKAAALGLSRRDRPREGEPPVAPDVVRALHGLGWSDTRIAAGLHTGQERVSEARRSLGLPALYGFTPGWGRRSN